jgi:hypothetical protein
MFDKIGRVAETMATRASLSRRGFLGRFARLAGGTALGMAMLMTPTKAGAGNVRCHCCKWPYGCDPNDQTCLGLCAPHCLALPRCQAYRNVVYP